MSNKVKDTLHELIKHMSKSEKRYFKVYASRHTIGEQNNYLLLFDFIEGMNEYDEQQVIKHFKGESFLKKFSITKKRLYDHIISSLDNYHSTHSVDAQIYKLLNSSEILLQKALYQQSVKQLKSAEKLALKNHKYNLLSEINLKLKKVYETQGVHDADEVQLMLQQDLLYHEKSSTYDKIWNLKSRLFNLLNSKGISRTEDDMKQFKALIDELVSPTLIEGKTEPILYNESEYLINHIYSAYYFATNELNLCITFLHKNVELLEHEREAIHDHESKYISTLTNAIYVSYRLGQKDWSNNYRDKLKTKMKEQALLAETSTKNEDIQIKLFSSYYSLDITLLILEGRFLEAKNLIPFIEQGILVYKEQLTESRKAFFWFKMAVVSFGLQEYHQALKYINLVLNNQHLDQQADILSFAHLLSLLIHTEIDNTSFMSYVLRSTSRFLKSRNRLYDFEQLFLKHITKLTKVNHQIDREEVWAKFYKELAISDDSTMRRVSYEYFDFSTWAKSKAERKSFSDLISLTNV